MRVLVASCGIALDLEQLKDSHNRLIYQERSFGEDSGRTLCRARTERQLRGAR